MDRLRLFTAVRPPQEVLAAIEDTAYRLRGRTGEKPVRWVRPENLHVTLQFLGNTPRELVPALTAAMREAAGEAPGEIGLSIDRVGAFPNARRPRTLWVGLTDTGGGLATLERALRRRLVGLEFELDERPFRPHVTVGYVRKRVSSAERQAITRALQQTDVETRSFLINELVLVRSETGPGGSRYTDLATVPLTAR